MPRLYVLPPSHFCERARWGLDHMGVAYVEEPWAVGVHVLLARRLAPATTLPILDVGTEIIQGSDRILDWTGIKGGNPDLEERFESRIGVLVRQFITLPRSLIIAPALEMLSWPAYRLARGSLRGSLGR